MLDNKTLQLKILSGYLILLTVIGSIVGILLHERSRMREIRKRAKELWEIHHRLYTAHQNVAELAFTGESVIGWNEADYRAYRKMRLKTDSLLSILGRNCAYFIQPEEVDSLRHLLEDKETHLLQIMQALAKQDEIDSLLVHRLPVVSRQVTRTRTVTRKKKGIAGFFGKKETVTVPASAKPLYELNDKLVNLQKQQNRRIDTHIDSLTVENGKLNANMIALIGQLNGRATSAFQQRTQEIDNMQRESFRWIASAVVFSLLLLMLSCWVIQKDLRQKAAGHRRLQKLLDEYNDLLEKRKRIILTLSHDIRGPLNIIGNYAKWAMEIRTKKKRTHYLQGILHSYNHILQLVNNLLDVYRLNSDKEVLNKAPFLLNSLLERIAHEYTLSANDKGLRFLKDFKSVDILVKGDPDRLEQVLDNLLTNAVKFTENGTISFSACYQNGMLDIDIEDTGIGMDGETVKRIFAPFEQAAPGTKAGGFGLGLSIVQGLVRLLGGEINVESRLGKGSIFHLTVPLPLTDEVVNDETTKKMDAINLPKFILLIDDDSLQLELCKEMLERNGVRCTACREAKDLVERMREHDYDLLLTDIRMPDLDGFGLLSLLRNSNIGNSRTIPIVAMTARGEHDAESILEAGFSGCIYKPFSSKELLSTISKYSHPANSQERFDFSSILEGIENKDEVLKAVITESAQNIQDLNLALKTIDNDVLRETLHRMFPLWEMLRQERILIDCRDTLSNSPTNQDKIRKQIIRVINSCQDLIHAAKNELNKP